MLRKPNDRPKKPQAVCDVRRDSLQGISDVKNPGELFRFVDLIQHAASNSGYREVWPRNINLNAAGVCHVWQTENSMQEVADDACCIKLAVIRQ
jgi:hypothetical protein